MKFLYCDVQCSTEQVNLLHFERKKTWLSCFCFFKSITSIFSLGLSASCGDDDDDDES